MKVKATRLFCSPIYGNVKEGDVIAVDESTALQLKELGLVEVEKVEKKTVKKTVKKGK